MDNLKFTACLKKTTEGPTSANVEVSSISSINKHFSAVISNFNVIQHPQNVLTQAGCKCFILENIAKSTYNYDIDANVINLTLDVNGLCTIKVTLHEKIREEKDYKLIVHELLQRLDDMEPYETIDHFKYPEWMKFSEFKELPDWKYFDAIMNYDRYLCLVDLKNKGSSNYYVQEDNILLTPTEHTTDIKQWPVLFAASKLFSSNNMLPLLPGQIYTPLTHPDTKNQYYRDWCDIFKQSIRKEDVVIKKYSDSGRIQLYINGDLYHYFSLLYRGWLLLNPHLYKTRIDHRYCVILQLYLNLDNLTLTIKRLKQSVEYPRFGNCHVPTAAMVDINGLHHGRWCVEIGKPQLFIIHKNVKNTVPHYW